MKILAIDDNEDIIELLDTILTDMGHKIITTNDGKEGLKLIQENSYDIILLDIAMPNFSGIDIINALEKEKTLKNHKIILFTASIKDAVLDELLKKGIRGVIQKPFKMEALEKQINKLV